jgi:hypothetical protein
MALFEDQHRMELDAFRRMAMAAPKRIDFGLDEEDDKSTLGSLLGIDGNAGSNLMSLLNRKPAATAFQDNGLSQAAGPDTSVQSAIDDITGPLGAPGVSLPAQGPLPGASPASPLASLASQAVPQAGPQAVPQAVPQIAQGGVPQGENEGTFLDRFFGGAPNGSILKAFGNGIFGKQRAKRQIQADNAAIRNESAFAALRSAQARTEQIKANEFVTFENNTGQRMNIPAWDAAGKNNAVASGFHKVNTPSATSNSDRIAAGEMLTFEKGGNTINIPAGEREMQEKAVGIGYRQVNTPKASGELSDSSATFILKRNEMMKADPDLSFEVATNIAAGRYGVDRDPVTGVAQIVDKANGNIIGAASPELTSAISESPKSKSDSLGLAFGPVDRVRQILAGAPGVGDIMEAVGLGGLEQRQAGVVTQALGKEIEVAFANNPRYAEGEMKRLLDMRPTQGFFTRDEAAAAEYQELRRILDGNLQRELEIANNPANSPEVRRIAGRTAEAAKRPIQMIDDLLAMSRFAVKVGKRVVPISELSNDDLNTLAPKLSELTDDQIRALADRRRQLNAGN